MQTVRIVKVDEYQFLLCVKHGLWGGTFNRYGKFGINDLIIFKVGKQVAGAAVVTGKSFEDDTMIWDTGLYPFRLPVKFTHIIDPDSRDSISDKVNQGLLDTYGYIYGWVIQSQVPLDPALAEIIIRELASVKNKCEQVVSNIDKELSKVSKLRENDKTGIFKETI